MRHRPLLLFAAASALLLSASISASAQNWASPYHCLKFNGVKDNFKLPIVNTVLNEFTIEFWARQAKYGQEGWIFNAVDPNDYNRFVRIGFNSDNNQMAFNGVCGNLGVANVKEGNSEVYTAWHHWAFTCGPDASGQRKLTIYRDGVRQWANDAGGAFNFHQPTLGWADVGWGNSYPFQGCLDEFRIWSKARTMEQIQWNMDGELTNPKGEADLLLNYRFNEGQGIYAYCAKTGWGGPLQNGLAEIQGPQWAPQEFGSFKNTTGMGKVKVTINPESARANLYWTVNGGFWCAWWQTLSEVAPGLQTLEFKPPPGWREPYPAVTALVAPGQTTEVTATLGEILDIELDSIPAQTFRPGGAPVEFGVRPTGVQGDLRYAAWVSGGSAPIGTCGFVGTSRYFKFKPSPYDKEPFIMTIGVSDASGKSPSRYQTVSFSPAFAVTPDSTCFTYQSKTAPDAGADDYFVYNESLTPGDETLNYQTGKLRIIEAAAPIIVIDDSDGNKFKGLNGNLNIKSLKLEADTIIVRKDFKLPGTNVEIWARQLIFEDQPGKDSSKFITTPESKPARPDPEQGIAGVGGLNGGAITLHVQSVSSPTHPGWWRFITTGGNGQPGGTGKKGNDGSGGNNVTQADFYGKPDGGGDWRFIWNKPGFLGRINELKNAGNDIAAEKVISVKVQGTITAPVLAFGYPWPTSGGDALVAPGKAGDSGNGGNISSNVNVRCIVGRAAGTKGERAPDAPGGTAGTPSPAWRAEKWTTTGWMFTQETTTQAGRSKAPPDACDGSAGGYNELPESPYSWIHPQSARLLALYFRDCYMQGHFSQDIREQMSYYVRVLDAYAADSRYNYLDGAARADLAQAREDVRVMLSRFDAGLDYFGNPAGWAPLLSFEATLAAFNTEIDYALKIIYLNKWIQSTSKTIEQRAAGMIAAQEQKWEELQRLKDAYTQASTEYDANRVEAEANAASVKTTQQALKSHDDYMQQMADERVNPTWKKIVTAALKGTSAVLSCIPFPATQVAAGAIDVGTSVLDTIQPHNLKWDQILSGVFNGLGEGGGEAMSAAATDMKDKTQLKIDMDGLDADKQALINGELKTIDKINQVAGGVKKVGSAVGSIVSSFTQSTANTPEVQAELDKMRLEDPTYIKLKGDVENLVRKREELALKIQNNLQTLQTVPTEYSACAVAINSIAQAIQAGTVAALPVRTNAALKDMAKRAEERLLRYQYYMGKAYEYRLLAPYAWENMSVASLSGECERLVNQAQGVDVLSKADFDTLKAFYKNIISQVANSIYTGYTEGDAKLKMQGQQTIVLPAHVVQAINNLKTGEAVAFNLFDLGVFPADQERLRIRFTTTGDDPGVSVSDMKMHRDGAEKDATLSVCDTSFSFIHSGRSRVWAGANSYDFRNFSQTAGNPIRWTIKYNDILPANKFSTVRPSPTDGSLLSNLLGTKPNTELFSYPAVDGLIYFQKNAMNNNDKAVRLVLDSLTLAINYEYAMRNSTAGKVDWRALDVATLGALSPSYALSASDAANRKDGVQSFRRIYPEGQGAFTVTAPATAGNSPFLKWTWVVNAERKEQADRVLTITPSEFAQRKVTAVYAAYGIMGQITTQETVGEVKPAVRLTLTGGNIPAGSPRETKLLRNGQYSFSDLAPGEYYVTPSFENVTFSPDSQRVVIQQEEILSYPGIDFNASYKACSIEGRLTGASPAVDVAGSTVTLTRDDAARTFVASMNCAADGAFKLTGIPSGTYRVKPTSSKCVFEPAESASITVSSAVDSAKVDFKAVAAAYKITGTILDESNSGVIGVSINLTNEDTGAAVATPAATAADGTYTLSCSEKGYFNLTPKKDGCAFSPEMRNLELSSSDNPGNDFKLVAKTYKIYGVVKKKTDSTAILKAPVKLTLKPSTVSFMDTETAADGSYSFAGLKPGSYEVNATPVGFKPVPKSRTIQDADKEVSFILAADAVAGKVTPSSLQARSADTSSAFGANVLLRNSADGGIYAGSGVRTAAAPQWLWSLGQRAATRGAVSTAYDFARGSVDYVGGGLDWEMQLIGAFAGRPECQILWKEKTTGMRLVNVASWENLFAVSPTAIDDLEPAAAGDFDGDGRDEILYRRASTGDLLVDLLLDGAPTAAIVRGLPESTEVVFCPDIDADGKDDLVLWDSASRKLTFALVNGAKITGGMRLSTAIPEEWELSGAADFSGDGKADLLWRNTKTGGLYIDAEVESGAFNPSHAVVPYGNPEMRVVATYDYDGDGYADILTASADGRNVIVHYLTGMTVRESATLPVTDDPQWRLLE